MRGLLRRGVGRAFGGGRRLARGEPGAFDELGQAGDDAAEIGGDQPGGVRGAEAGQGETEEPGAHGFARLRLDDAQDFFDQHQKAQGRRKGRVGDHDQDYSLFKGEMSRHFSY